MPAYSWNSGAELLVFRLVGVVLLGVCLLLLASATVSHTFGMNTSCVHAYHFVMSFMFKVRQGLVLCDGFVYGLDLSPLQIFCEVGNLKR